MAMEKEQEHMITNHRKEIPARYRHYVRHKEWLILEQVAWAESG